MVDNVPEEFVEANPEAMTQTLLCLDKPEQAADLMVERLSNSTQVDDALEAFWKFSSPSDGPKFLSELHDRADRMKRMDRVQKALTEAGRAIAVPGPTNAWSNF